MKIFYGKTVEFFDEVKRYMYGGSFSSGVKLFDTPRKLKLGETEVLIEAAKSGVLDEEAAAYGGDVQEVAWVRLAAPFRFSVLYNDKEKITVTLAKTDYHFALTRDGKIANTEEEEVELENNMFLPLPNGQKILVNAVSFTMDYMNNAVRLKSVRLVQDEVVKPSLFDRLFKKKTPWLLTQGTILQLDNPMLTQF